jgi:Acyclic terpene utilisation family protein AtuA
VITKLPEAGGKVDRSTCKEQLIYEIHDPSAYLTPDVTADFSGVSFEEAGPDRVRVSGGQGRKRPEQLKVSIGYHGGYIGEGSIGYAGPGAEARARLAAETVRERLSLIGARFSEIRFDLLGVNALHREASATEGYEPYEVILRVAAKTASLKDAQVIGNEVETLYTNGPAGGGGAVKGTREIVAVASTLIPRVAVAPQFSLKEVD